MKLCRIGKKGKEKPAPIDDEDSIKVCHSQLMILTHQRITSFVQNFEISN